MSYPKLCEGNRIWTAGSGNNISAADFVELNDQLKAMLGSREIGLTHFGQPPSGWTFNRTTSLWEYDGSTAAPNDRMWFPIPAYAGQKLTEIYIAVEVVTKGTTGDVKLIRRLKTPTAGSMPAYANDTLIANVWNVATDNYATLQSATGMAYTFLAGYNYFIDVTPRTGVVCKIHELTAVLQFGN